MMEFGWDGRRERVVGRGLFIVLVKGARRREGWANIAWGPPRIRIHGSCVYTVLVVNVML